MIVPDRSTTVWPSGAWAASLWNRSSLRRWASLSSTSAVTSAKVPTKRVTAPDSSYAGAPRASTWRIAPSGRIRRQDISKPSPVRLDSM